MAQRIRLTEDGAPEFHKLQIVYDVNSPGGLASVNEPATSVRPASLTDSSQPCRYQ